MTWHQGIDQQAECDPVTDEPVHVYLTSALQNHSVTHGLSYSLLSNSKRFSWFSCTVKILIHDYIITGGYMYFCAVNVNSRVTICTYKHPLAAGFKAFSPAACTLNWFGKIEIEMHPSIWILTACQWLVTAQLDPAGGNNQRILEFCSWHNTKALTMQAIYCIQLPQLKSGMLSRGFPTSWRTGVCHVCGACDWGRWSREVKLISCHETACCGCYGLIRTLQGCFISRTSFRFTVTQWAHVRWMEMWKEVCRTVSGETVTVIVYIDIYIYIVWLYFIIITA